MTSLTSYRLRAALCAASLLAFTRCGENSLTKAELCAQLDDLQSGGEAKALRVNLSEAVELELSSTAAECGDGTNCCNWSYGFYLVRCGDDDIVVTAEGTPFGKQTAEPGEGADDDFEAVSVTLGCQGMACDAACVPARADDFGVVEAELRAVDDEISWMGEAVSAVAELRVTARVD